MILFLIMNFITGATSFLIIYKILQPFGPQDDQSGKKLLDRSFRIYDLIDSVILWFLLYFSQIVLSELILGMMGKLYIGNLILLNVLLLLVAAGFSLRRPTQAKACGCLLYLHRLFNNRIILFCISILLGFGLVKILINLVNPPFGWDCLNYHFSFPVEWMKHGNLSIMTTIADDPSPPYYPINGSLLFLWLIMPFKNVFIADLSQVPFFILAFFSIYNICKKLGIDKELSFYTAGLFLITPNVFKQLEIAYVDIMLAALFLAGLNFLISLYKKFSLKDFLAFSVSFGLFLGIKTSALIYGIFLLLLFIVILSKNLKQTGIMKSIIYLLLFLLIVTSLGGFSYIRNLIITGNALYPAEIKILGKKIFHGVMPFSTYRDKWTTQDYNLGKLLFREGMGIQFLVFVVPAFILSLPVIVMKRKFPLHPTFEKGDSPEFPPFEKGGIKGGFLHIYILSLPVLLYLAFWFFMPQLWVRYLYPFVACGFITAMYLVNDIPLTLYPLPSGERVRVRSIIRTVVVICFIASAAELSGHLELISSAVLSVLFFIFLPRIIEKLHLKFILTFLFLTITALYFLNSDYKKNEFKRYLKNSPYPYEEREAWFWLNGHTNNVKIAYTGSPDTLPLYAANFKNNAFYVSVNNTHPAKLYYFPNAKYVWSGDFLSLHKNLEKTGNYRQNPDFNSWLNNLRYERADYLFIYALHQVKDIIFPVEDSWAKSHPEIFDSVFNNRKVHIYKINNNSLL